MRVCDHEVAVDTANREPGRAAGFLLWCLPTADEVAVGVKHLDACRHVDDVKLVVGVDRDRPRLAELTVAAAKAAPDFLGRSVLRFAASGAAAERRRQRGGGRELAELPPAE